jgi:WD40 repeat protein
LLIFTFAWAASLAHAAPPITAAAFTPDGKAVVVGSQAGLTTYAWPDLQPQGPLNSKLANIHDLAFSPQGDVLLAAGGKPAEEGSIELRAWPAREPVATIVAGNDVVYGVDWRADGAVFAAACGDRQVRLFDRQGKPLRDCQGHSRPVLAVRFLPGGQLLSAARDQSIRLWDAETGRAVRSLDNHTAAATGLAVRPGVAEGAPPWVASIGADRTLRFWQPTIGRLVRFARLPSEPLALQWTADGSRVAVACADGHLRLIDPETVEITADLPVWEGWAYTLARSPAGGAMLVAGHDGRMRRIALP